MDIEKIAVLGAGNGGQAVAADLSLAGYKVNIYNRSSGRLDSIIKSGGIEISGDVIEGFAKLNKVTNNIKEAIEDVDLIVVVVPTTAHKFMAEACAPYLKEGQVIFLNPGHTGGALEFTKTLRDLGVNKNIKICESSSLTFICRLMGPAKVKVTYRSKGLLFSAFPAKYTSEFLDYINEVFPGLVPAVNVLETGLDNYNAILHPPGMLMNAGWIEHTKGNFYYYSEGITPSVGRVTEALDAERMSIAKTLGFKPSRYVEHAFKSGLSTVRDGSLYETIQAEEANRYIKVGDSLRDRFVEEDVGYGIVPMALIGDVLGVSTPIMGALINLASVANQVDYWKKGRTLEKMGIAGLSSIEELNRFVSGN